MLGTSQPSFEPKSKARTILVALFLSGLIAISLKITILPLDHNKNVVLQENVVVRLMTLEHLQMLTDGKSSGVR